MGILKNWSRNAFADALEDGAKTVTLKHLERRALSIGQCRNILKKIKEGEKRYTEIEGEVEKLRKELELGIEPVSRKQKPSKSDTDSNQKTSQKPKSKKAVGQRNAKRDSVGIEKNAG